MLPLLSLLLVQAGCAAARHPPAPARLSLHPPYFNLAEVARIWATATCGEREPGGARPRPELYCKLVGGPTAPGSGHTIQVRSRGDRGRRAPSPRGAATLRRRGRTLSLALSWGTPAGLRGLRRWARCPGVILGSTALGDRPLEGGMGEAREVKG